MVKRDLLFLFGGRGGSCWTAMAALYWYVIRLPEKGRQLFRVMMGKNEIFVLMMSGLLSCFCKDTWVSRERRDGVE